MNPHKLIFFNQILKPDFFNILQLMFKIGNNHQLILEQGNNIQTIQIHATGRNTQVGRAGPNSRNNVFGQFFFQLNIHIGVFKQERR